MKKIDSKDKARTYGQNEKIWYLCMPYSFLNEEHTLDLDAEMGDRGLIIYFRLLMMATASQGVLKLDTRRISPLQRLAGRLQHRYTEDEIAQVLEILDENDMVKIIEGGEEIKFRDVYEMAVEKQRRAAEKRKAEGTAAYEGGETLEDDTEEADEQPEETEAEPEETEEERKKRDKKEAAKKREEDLAQFLDAWKQTDMPKILKLQPDRKKKLMARIDDYGIENMLKAVEIANNNRFLRGLVPPKPDEDPKKKPWKATIDFFCQASAVSKILEGKYDRFGTVNDTKPAQPQAPILVTDLMVDSAIFGDDLTRENWNDKKAAYMPELQAAIEKALFK